MMIIIVCAMIIYGIGLVQLQQINTDISRRLFLFNGVRSRARNNTDPEHSSHGILSGDYPGKFEAIHCSKECQRKKDMAKEVDCVAVMEGDKEAQTKAKQYLRQHPKLWYTDTTLIRAAENCSDYLSETYYPRLAHSSAEAEFPIAYSIVAHMDAYQLERLLQSIYWPQNWYCIHIDLKAKGKIADFVSNLAQCLPNVIVPTRRESVIYGGISRLKADLNCMEELLRHNRTWRYVINLTGQEFSLRTNREIVQILKIYNGANDIEGVSKQKSAGFGRRFRYHWETDSHGRLEKKANVTKGPPPGNITLIKGSVFGVFTREFVQAVLNNDLAQ